MRELKKKVRPLFSKPDRTDKTCFRALQPETFSRAHHAHIRIPSAVAAYTRYLREVPPFSRVFSVPGLTTYTTQVLLRRHAPRKATFFLIGKRFCSQNKQEPQGPIKHATVGTFPVRQSTFSRASRTVYIGHRVNGRSFTFVSLPSKCKASRGHLGHQACVPPRVPTLSLAPSN